MVEKVSPKQTEKQTDLTKVIVSPHMDRVKIFFLSK